MKTERGLTLLELLLAITVAALVLTTVYGVFTRVAAVRERVAAESENDRRGRVLFERLGRELRSAWRSEDEPAFFRLVFDRDQRQELSFASAGGTLAARGLGGIAALRYRLQPRAADLELQRHELPYYRRSELDASRGELLCNNLRDLRWRVRAGGDWQETWEEQRWPQQVEVTATFGDPHGDTVLRSIFVLPVLGGTP